MKEWDVNKDDVISKIEFKKAVRISLRLNATNDHIDSLCVVAGPLLLLCLFLRFCEFVPPYRL